jgi:phasin family protein
MSNPDFEKMFGAHKASTEMLSGIMRTSFEGMQRLAELNMTMAQEAFSSAVTSANKLASSKDAKDMSSLNQQMPKPEAMMEYWRDVYNIVSGMQKDVTTLMQANYSQLSETMAAAMDQKKMPGMGGGEVFASAMKNMLEQSNKAFENMTAAAGKMAHMTGAPVKAAGSSPAPKSANVSSFTKKK